jgi:hypothetical protein
MPDDCNHLERDCDLEISAYPRADPVKGLVDKSAYPQLVSGSDEEQNLANGRKARCKVCYGARRTANQGNRLPEFWHHTIRGAFNDARVILSPLGCEHMVNPLGGSS